MDEIWERILQVHSVGFIWAWWLCGVWLVGWFVWSVGWFWLVQVLVGQCITKNHSCDRSVILSSKRTKKKKH